MQAELHLPGQQKPQYFFPAGIQPPWQKERRRRAQALLFSCIKFYLHWWYNYTGKELRTAVSKLPPLGAEKLVESKWAWWVAGGKLEGEQWEVNLDQKGRAKFTTLLGVQCLWMLDHTMKQDCPDTVQRLSRQQTVSQLISRDKHWQLRSCLLF